MYICHILYFDDTLHTVKIIQYWQAPNIKKFMPTVKTVNGR
jgi:hypothetical protein